MGEKKATDLTKEEWAEKFVAYFEKAHCSLFGRHMPVAVADEREETAKWYAEVVMRVLSGDQKD
jgi:hypothetical protein